MFPPYISKCCFSSSADFFNVVVIIGTVHTMAKKEPLKFLFGISRVSYTLSCIIYMYESGRKTEKSRTLL